MPGRGRPFAKGQPRAAGAGRKKGTPNRVSGAFRQALLDAFERIGGVDELTRWAEDEKNRLEFYRLCGRLVPTEIVASDPSALLPRVEFIWHQPADATQTGGGR
jgi:hypothetical protein